MTSGPIETLSWVVAKVLRLFCFLLLLSSLHCAWHYIRLSGRGKSRSFFQGLVLRKRLSPFKICTSQTCLIHWLTARPKRHHVEACAWKCHKIPEGQVEVFMLLSTVGKKWKLTAQQTESSKLTLSCFSVNIFVQEIQEKLMLEGLNKRQTRRARPSLTDSLFSSLFFERTADFGHMPGVRLQVLDDFSTAYAWTVFVPEWSSVWTLTEQETSLACSFFVSMFCS